MSSSTDNGHGSSRIYIWVWLWLVALTAVEIVLAFQALPVTVMLLLLISLSLVKAGLIISYFMHLLHETRGLKWSMIPPMVIVIVLMFGFFPDSLRLLNLMP